MDKLNIEVGSRSSSMIDILRDDLVPDGRLICIDKRNGWLLSAGESFKHKYTPITADGSKLPMSDNSVDSIYAKDLFGSFDNMAITPENEIVYEKKTENIPKEWSRVCRQGAKVVILELSTPYPESSLVQEFNKAGFDLVEYGEGNDVNMVFKPGISLPVERQDPPPYYLVLEKS